MHRCIKEGDTRVPGRVPDDRFQVLLSAPMLAIHEDLAARSAPSRALMTERYSRCIRNKRCGGESQHTQTDEK